MQNYDMELYRAGMDHDKTMGCLGCLTWGSCVKDIRQE